MLHFMVNFEDKVLGSVFAEFLFIFLLNYWEGFKDVVDIISLDIIEMEEGDGSFRKVMQRAFFHDSK